MGIPKRDEYERELVQIMSDKEIGKAAHVWMCTFCNAPYETEAEAVKCWGSHTEIVAEYVWGGIGSDDMPTEIVVKKYEGGSITKISTYELKETSKVNIRERIRTT